MSSEPGVTLFTGRPRSAAALVRVLGAAAGLAVAALAGEARAQGIPTLPVCGGSVRSVSLDRDYVVDARAVVGVDGGLLMLGQLAGRIDRRSTTPGLDSSIVAVLARDDGTAVGVPAPQPAMRVTDAKAIAISDDAARVFFHTSDRFAEHESFELWTGVVRGGRWSGVRSLGMFTNAVLMGAEVSDSPVEWRGTQVLGFAQDSEVVLLTARGDSTQVVRLRTRLRSIGDVSLVAEADDLWVALAAAGDETRLFGDIYVGRVIGDSIADIHRVVVGATRRVLQPRLLSSSEGVVLAWVAEDPETGTTSLGWRAVGDASAPEHRLPARWPIARGAYPFTHLLSVPVSDRTAIIAELLPQGLLTLAVIESRAFAPAIGGSRDRLRAVSWVSDPAKPSSRRIAIHDLDCALSSARPSGR